MTSPPYNLGKAYETRKTLSQYLEEQALLIAELPRVLTDDGSLCWEVGNYVENGEIFPLDIFFYRIFKEYGMKLRNRIIWRYGNGLHASRRFSGRYETILWFTKTDHYFFDLDPVRVPSKYPGKRYFKGPHKGELSGNPMGKNPSDIWEILRDDWDNQIWDIPNVKHNHPEKTIHPCQFPIELAERCVLALTRVGDIIYDPYAGVATSLLAAIKHGRGALGSEKDAEYVALGWQRIHALQEGILPNRKLGTPIYVPRQSKKAGEG